jgi:hypothetical protein
MLNYRLTDAQFGVLCRLVDYGDICAEEIPGPVGPNGKRKSRLISPYLNITTLKKMEDEGLVTVRRSPISQARGTGGKKGLPRKLATISITPAGQEALNKLLKA